MPLQPPLTQPAYDDLHAILTHYEAQETGLGHRIAHRLRDKARRGTLHGASSTPFGGNEGCILCTVQQCVEDIPNTANWRNASVWHDWNTSVLHDSNNGIETWAITNIKAGMTPADSPAADALDACIEDWQHIQEATLPTHSVKVVAQGWTPRELAALKAEVSP